MLAWRKDIKPSQVLGVNSFGLLPRNGLLKQKGVCESGAGQSRQHTLEKGSNCPGLALTSKIWRSLAD